MSRDDPPLAANCLIFLFRNPVTSWPSGSNKPSRSENANGARKCTSPTNLVKVGRRDYGTRTSFPLT